MMAGALVEETRKKTATSKRSRDRRPSGDQVRRLEIHQILNILPHRYPFVMVDRVSEALAYKYARGHKCVSYNEPFFQGHFPTGPVMPGVLVIEALSQLGAVLAYVSQPFDPATSVMYFLGINNAKFRRQVVPGDRMDLYVEITHHDSNVWNFSAEATVDGTVCTEAELLASVVDR
jgi:3-hydroxyacyl-[acyl-carrier-protein] dehydratase